MPSHLLVIRDFPLLSYLMFSIKSLSHYILGISRSNENEVFLKTSPCLKLHIVSKKKSLLQATRKLNASQKDHIVLIDDIEEEQEYNAFDFH